MTRLQNILITALLLMLAGCDSCSKSEPAPEPEPTEPAHVEPAPVEDPLKEARENAEKDADTLSLHISDLAQLVAADIEAAQKPKTATRPKSEPENGKIDVNAVKRIFGAHNGAMKKCYERSLKNNPNLQGRVNLEVLIKSDGSVGSAKAKAGSLRDTLVFDCMERHALTMVFPKPDGGAVRVNNPYSFSPDF